MYLSGWAMRQIDWYVLESRLRSLMAENTSPRSRGSFSASLRASFLLFFLDQNILIQHSAKTYKIFYSPVNASPCPDVFDDECIPVEQVHSSYQHLVQQDYLAYYDNVFGRDGLASTDLDLESAGESWSRELMAIGGVFFPRTSACQEEDVN